VRVKGAPCDACFDGCGMLCLLLVLTAGLGDYNIRNLKAVKNCIVMVVKGLIGVPPTDLSLLVQMRYT
jgi:hypothetical protein